MIYANDNSNIIILNPHKRRRVHTKFKKKKKIVQEYCQAVKGLKKQVLHKYGIQRCHIIRWKKVLAYIQNDQTYDDKYTIHHGMTPQLREMEILIKNEICSFRDAMIPVTGPLVRMIALKYAREKGIQGFKASDGWLDRFKHRHNFSFRKGTKRLYRMTGHTLYELEHFHRQVHAYIAQGIEVIVNIDETHSMIDRIVKC